MMRLPAGVNLVSEHVILDTPSAICPFYEEQKGPGTRIPSLAVACGQTIYIYKRLRPHYKFRLPAAPISEEEAEVWKGLNEETLIADMAARNRALFAWTEALDMPLDENWRPE
jgi:Bardet-Biedl syndrome 1 protein